MNENDDIIQLPEWENTLPINADPQLDIDLTRNWLDYTQHYPEPHYLFEFEGVPFAPLGGIQAITGQKKNGKTFVMCQLMAAVLSNNSERMRAQLPGLTLHEETRQSLGHDPVVLYIDTEMEKLNTVKVVRRIQWLCNWDYEKANDRLKVLWLRAEESNAIRWKKTKKAIEEVQPTVVFLDGIRDVIGDFNDNKESADLISECMKMATEMNCCIFSVLHENPGSDKMRGHLGTELGNKVTDTFVSVKKKEDNIITFSVKQVDARGKDVPDWKFEITEDAGSLGIPRIITDPAKLIAKYENNGGITDDEWVTIMRNMKGIIQPPKTISFTALRDGLKKVMHKGSENANKYIKKAIEENILIEVNGRYSFNIQNADAAINKLPF